jgi:hypothetical protein
VVLEKNENRPTLVCLSELGYLCFFITMILNLKNHPVWGEGGKGMVGGQGEILPQWPMFFWENGHTKMFLRLANSCQISDFLFLK